MRTSTVTCDRCHQPCTDDYVEVRVYPFRVAGTVPDPLDQTREVCRSCGEFVLGLVREAIEKRGSQAVST